MRESTIGTDVTEAGVESDGRVVDEFGVVKGKVGCCGQRSGWRWQVGSHMTYARVPGLTSRKIGRLQILL